jgi:hypothetical protein
MPSAPTKDKKLYQVIIGLLNKSGDCTNWRKEAIVALDAKQAMEKAVLAKSEYVVEVQMASIVDRL